MTELAPFVEQTPLTAQMDYARAVSSASMLPDNYRGKPADILLAVGLGQSMGLSPAESLYRISVIKGKPTASAELVAANVRKAGHRLRVSIEPGKATCSIWRSDDPDYEFKVVRDAQWARDMGLANNDNYKKQGDTMLSWRAITACARLACPEALYGVAYTSDEMFDMDRRQPPTNSGAEVSREPSLLSDSAGVVDGPAPESPLTQRTRGEMFALFAQKGIAEDEQLAGINHICGTEYSSRSELTEADGLAVVRVLRTRPDVSVEEPVEAEVVDECGAL